MEKINTDKQAGTERHAGRDLQKQTQTYIGKHKVTDIHKQTDKHRYTNLD